MALKNGYDQPEGVIVGGEYVSWQVFYDGRAQSGKNYAESDEAAEEQGRILVTNLCAEHCGYPCYLYPEPSLWTIRIGV